MSTYKFNTNAWHLKLMNWCWGLESQDIGNMCPYFWSTILTIVTMPFSVLFILCAKGVKNLAKKRAIGLIQDYLNLVELTNSDWIALYNALELSGASRRMQIKKKFGKKTYEEVYQKAADVDYERIRENDKKKYEKESRLLARKKERRQTIGQFYSKTKWIANLFIYGIGAVALYYLGHALVYLFLLLPTIDWLNLLEVVGAMVGIFAAIIAVIGGGVWAIEKIDIGDRFTNFFSYLGEWYNDNCPAIEWEDEE